MENQYPNIVLVTADSVRADYCGFLGGKYNTTPALSKLAEDGLSFTCAIAPGPRTPSSIPEIFTGKPLPEAEPTNTLEQRNARVRNHMSNNETIAQRLQSEGYSTAAFTANPWTTKATNFDAGFDHFVEVGLNNDYNYLSNFEGTKLGPLADLFIQWRNKQDWFSQWPTFYDEIIEMASTLEEPYFLWVFLLDTHNPYIVPRKDRVETNAFSMYYGLLRGNSVLGESAGGSAYRETMPSHVEKALKKTYRDSIRSVDRFIGKISCDLSETDPVLVFHSDHGEAFNEHGTYGHQGELFEENIRVPLFVHNEGKSGRITDPVSLRNLPNILSSVIDSDIHSPKKWTDDAVFSGTEDRTVFSLRTSECKFIKEKPKVDDKFFDLQLDPGERNNIVNEDERVKKLHGSLVEQINSLPEANQGKEETVDVIAERLKSLGYVDK
jgi:arylsulfatase A-like enzyme